MTYIESLYIVSFGALRNFGVELTSGLNIIEGDNESGKSTVCDFIRFIFYGFSGKDDRERHIGFSSGSAEGSAIINKDGKRYRIERRTVGVRENTAVIDLDDGSQVFRSRVPGEVFFGLPESLFVSTVFVGQTGGRKINGTETSQAVENLLFSADETVSVQKTLKALDKARTELRHKFKRCGVIPRTEDLVAELGQRFAEASKRNGEIISLGGSIEDLRKSLESQEAHYDRLYSAVLDCDILEARKKTEKLDALEAEYKRAVSAADDFKKEKTRNGFFPDKVYYDQIRNCGEELTRAIAKVKETEDELEALNTEMSVSRTDADRTTQDIRIKKERFISRRNLAVSGEIIFFLLFVVGTAASVLMFLGKSTVYGVLVAIASLLFFGAMIGGIVLSSRFSREIKNLQDIEENREDRFRTRLEYIREDLERARAEKKRYRSMFDGLCGKWDMPSNGTTVSEIKYTLDREAELLREAELARVSYVSYKTSMAENSENDPEDHGREITLPEGFDYKEYKRRMSFLSATIKRDREKLHKDELELARLSASEESATELLEEKTALEYRLAELNERCNAYLMAYEKIEEASIKMRNSISPKLSQSAGRLMSSITDGKYGEIGVDSGFSLSFCPETEGGGRITKGEEFMSAGTRDGAYVSLRMAIAELLCGDEAVPPMIFDESFSRLDDRRLTRLLKIIEAGKGQAIVLTSLDREARLCLLAGIETNAVSLSK